MEGKANQGPVVYEEFEPLCKWQRHEERDILEIHLPEFKKDQLKVQISNHGLLKISGERPLDAPRKSKFYKEFQLSSKYDSPAIHAKFVNSWLHITMPKRKNTTPEKIHEKEQTGTSKIDQAPRFESKAPTPNDNVQRTDLNGSPTPEITGQKLAKSGVGTAKVAAVTMAITVTMMGILAAYVLYMYKSAHSQTDDCDYRSF